MICGVSVLFRTAVFVIVLIKCLSGAVIHIHDIDLVSGLTPILT